MSHARPSGTAFLCRTQAGQCSACRVVHGWRHQLGVSLDGCLEIGERHDPERCQARSGRDIDQLMLDQQTDVPWHLPQCVGNGTLVAHGLHFREGVADDLQSVGIVGSLPVCATSKVRGLGHTAADGGDVGEKAEGGLGPRHQCEGDQRRCSGGPGVIQVSSTSIVGSGRRWCQGRSKGADGRVRTEGADGGTRDATEAAADADAPKPKAQRRTPEAE